MSLLYKYSSYPPAETQIPVAAFISALFTKRAPLEDVISEYLGVKNCILASNCRGLLYRLLQNLHHHDADHRDEILIPGYTCYSVAASVAKAGLSIRTYDINPSTHHPVLDSIETAITDKTLAIISQHLFGIPAPVNSINELARRNHIYHIEDAAQALGGSIDGVPLGATGDFGFYSFGRGKALPVGTGAALIGKDTDLLQDLKICQCGSGYPQFLTAAITQILSKPLLYWLPEILPFGLGETSFEPDFSVTLMPGIMQSLAVRLIQSLDDMNAHRRSIAGIYNGHFTTSSRIQAGPEAQPVYTRYPFTTAPGQVPHDLKRLGIRRMYPKAILDVAEIQPFLANKQCDTPGARNIAQNLITLPTHKGISSDLARIIACKVSAFYNPPP